MVWLLVISKTHSGELAVKGCHARGLGVRKSPRGRILLIYQYRRRLLLETGGGIAAVGVVFVGDFEVPLTTHL